MSDRNGGTSAHDRRPVSSPRQQALLALVETAGQPISTTQLARLTGETLGATAHHVRALAAAGLLDWAGERRARGALQTFYVLSDAGRDVLKVSRAHLLTQLFGYPAGPDGRPVVIRLDDQAIDDVEAVLERCRPDYYGIVLAAAERQASPDGAHG